MDLKRMIRKLSSVVDPEGTVVTLTLDLSKSGILPTATRIFLKDRVDKDLGSEARPAETQKALRKIARRIRDYVERGIDPGTNGLYLVAGPSLWEPLELQVPLRNFVHVGRSPYLAPLLEVAARVPRAWVVHLEPSSAQVEEVHLAGRRTVATIQGNAPGGRRSASKKTGYPGRGGAERDMRQRRDGEIVHSLLREAADEVARLEGEAEVIYLSGRKEHFKAFREALPSRLRERAVFGGTPASIQRDLERRAAERTNKEVLDFHERRQRGLMTALGPRDVLEHLSQGTVARVYVDPDDPIPGVVCGGCGARTPGLSERCHLCSEDVVPTSITQEVVAHALAHPPLALTFVPLKTGWLRDLDGMAATLSAAR